uniref:AAA family ATPase n=1 Tax=Arthrobacter sp. TaxID=1667 RepID=UPI000EB786C1|nr:AAA family ATPase [Arthrobacter sp.]AXV46429.1 partitioning protein ParA [Arthrobacter sp.]
MAIDQSLIQSTPVISAIINADNTGVLTVDGTEEQFTAEDSNSLRSQLMSRVFEVALDHDRPVRVSTMDESGLTGLRVSPDRQVEAEDTDEALTPQNQETATPAQTPEPAAAIENAGKTAKKAPATRLNETASSASAPVSSPVPKAPLVRTEAALSPVQEPTQPAPVTRRTLREAESFLSPHAATQPATQGMRGWLTTLGINIPPSERELAERIDVEHVSKHWAGTRTIMVANRKGGANKTPTVKNLAAIFALHGGGGVLAYDGNPEVGTLGWRTEKGNHNSTVLDVLENSDRLLSASAVSGDMAGYVHHQSEDRFDVLRSDDSLVGTHVMTGEDVDTIHAVAAKYYRLLVMDSGNVDRGSDWARMIAHTNQLVVPTTTMEDRAEAALLTLKALHERDEHAAKLAENAVVIISQWQPGEKVVADRIAEGFRPFVREVVTVPFDPALKSGRIVHSALSSASRRAWLRATAAVAQGL